MGGNSDSTTQSLGQLLGTGTGYTQPNQVAPITQPQYPAALTPTPEQAASATQARMQARTPMAAPAAAPIKKPVQWTHGGGSNR